MRAAAALLGAALAALPPAAACAQMVVPSGQSPRRAGPPAVQLCVGCHGAQGEGSPAVRAPRIAGQPAAYLARQLQSFADGSRRNPTMEAMAKALAPEDMAALAAHYARIDAPPAEPVPVAPPPTRGVQLATTGDDARGVSACANCHGPGGVGQPPASPYLAGLDAGYLSAALHAWQDGTRRNDAGRQMWTVAMALSREDIGAVAQYYASRPPPKPWPPDVVRAPAPAAPARGPGSPPGPAGGGGPPAPAVGTGQGAPTGAGTQGPGGAGGDRDAPDAAGAGSRAQPPPTGLGPTRRGDPSRGRAIVASGVHGCAACHAIPGIRTARGVVGPPLDALSRRAFIAGQLPNNFDTLVAFLQDPPALVPRTGMPNVGLSLDEARHVASFLHGLERAGAR